MKVSVAPMHHRGVELAALHAIESFRLCRASARLVLMSFELIDNGRSLIGRKRMICGGSTADMFGMSDRVELAEDGIFARGVVVATRDSGQWVYVRWLERAGMDGHVTIERASDLRKGAGKGVSRRDSRIETVKSRLSDGTLRRDQYNRAWYAMGNGRPCQGCSHPISALETEVEVDFLDRSNLRFHSRCFVCWRDATQRQPRFDRSA